MDAFVAGPFDLKVGSTTYRTDIYVAPIDDNMLLGLDFIFKSKAILDCAKQVLLINGEPVPLMYGSAELVPIPGIIQVFSFNRFTDAFSFVKFNDTVSHIQ
jgi:hypothetical protein